MARISRVGPSSRITWPAGFAQGTIGTPSEGSIVTGTGGNFTWNVGTLEAGDTETVTVSYTVPSGTTAGSYTNTVEVTTDTPESDTTNNSDDDTNTVVELADVSVTKDDGVTSVTAGDSTTYTYTISVTNTGPSDADNVSVADTWPAGFTQGAFGTPSEGTIVTGTGGDFTWNIGTVEAGEIKAGGVVITQVAYRVAAQDMVINEAVSCLAAKVED